LVYASEIAFLTIKQPKQSYYNFWLRAAILVSTKMQMVFNDGRRSAMLATYKNMVLAFEVAYLPALQAKLSLLPFGDR
jgi:hypothetical protein